jgi:hypothetical protein
MGSETVGNKFSSTHLLEKEIKWLLYPNGKVQTHEAAIAIWAVFRSLNT